MSGLRHRPGKKVFLARDSDESTQVVGSRLWFGCHFLRPDLEVKVLCSARCWASTATIVIQFTIQGKSLDAEHWVGGGKGFAHPEPSKTHTRTRGVSDKRKVEGFWPKADARKPEADSRGRYLTTE
jgi:hypothetical protein